MAELWGGWVFWIVFVLSLTTLLIPNPSLQGVTTPVLILLCIGGLVSSALALIWQTDGNQMLRANQLTDAFRVPVGSMARTGYYNNEFPPSMDRLAATIFENSLFSSRVLDRMLMKERWTVALYAVVFVLLMTYRGSSLELLLLLAQTVFSVDVVFRWVRMERYLRRVCCVNRELRQFFVQGGTTTDPRGLAIVLKAFSDYECAKDEAGMPLDSTVFRAINPLVTKEWDVMRSELKIP